jgi:hypothetical protein
MGNPQQTTGNGSGIKEPAGLIPSVIVLLAANLVPVYGVIVLGWKVFPIILLFWIENIIIGALNVLKMIFASPSSWGNWLGKIFIVPLFCIHYGMFTFVHGIFVLGLFGGAFRTGAPFPNIDTVLNLIRTDHLHWAILGLAVSHSVSFVANYLGRGEYRQASVTALMQQPYGRVVVMHITLLGGGFLLMAMHSPMAGLLVLVALKIFLDVRTHLKERRKFQAPQTSNVNAGACQ